MRIEGYSAIVRMSEEQLRWVERNVDVLVWLLQSGECHLQVLPDLLSFLFPSRRKSTVSSSFLFPFPFFFCFII
ncbi:hypothetical protein BGW80DRAFT_1379270 [Lactifluus volemus]|nr:hypothetical protein BGW80DRAFT_1379270 [Lactifluus volemus]